MTFKRPFRWTRQNKNIRTLLHGGVSKDAILDMVREQLPEDTRPSEAAMTVASWSQEIDEVAARMQE
jgi:hypothetical protein